MSDLNRYVIRASASPESTGEFVASFVEGSPQPLNLELEALKCTRRPGSPGSLDPRDYQDLAPVENTDVEIVYRPRESSYISFENECNDPDVRKKLLVIGGTLAIIGCLDLPEDDSFAIRVREGFSTRLIDGFTLRQITSTKTKKKELKYIFKDKVFEASPN